MEEVVYGTLSQMCQEHFQFLHLKQFDEFWQCNIEAEKTDEYIEIKSVININYEFNTKINRYKQEIRKSYDNMEKYAKIFQKSIEFWKYLEEVEKEDLRTKNCDSFKEIMYRCKVEMNSIREIENEKQIGIICLNCASHKQSL